MTYYPILLNLDGRPALVIGGGVVAERKVAPLLEAGARVTVVSPEVTAQLREWRDAGRIEWRMKRFEENDAAEFRLVIAATDDPETQRAAQSAGARHGALVNVVDQPDLCDFILPAITRRGDVIVAVSTSGKSPALAAAIRSRLDDALPSDIERAARILGAVREEARQRFADPEERKLAFERVMASGILDWIHDHDDDAALARVRQLMKLDNADSIS